MIMISELSIPISSIILDTKNPRIRSANDQRDAIDKIISIPGNKEKVINIAFDIAENGLNPHDKIGVVKHKDIGKYIVIEGNRRITALKFLTSPDLARDFISVTGKFKKALEIFEQQPITKVNCIVYDKREESDHWVELKHTGENQGVGTVKWESEAIEYFNQAVKNKSKSIGLQIKEELLKIYPQHTDSIEYMLKTNYDRLFSDASIKYALDYKFSDGSLEFIEDKATTMAIIIVMVLVFHLKKYSVTNIYHKDDRMNFYNEIQKDIKMGNIPKINKPSQDNQANNDETEEESDSKDERSSHNKTRFSIIPSSSAIKIGKDENRLKSILRELKKLSVSTFPNASAVLLRVFIELTMDYLIEQHPGEINCTEQKSLHKKVKKVVEFYKYKGIVNEKESETILMLSDESNKYDVSSTTTLNSYVHNRHNDPISDNLIKTWNNIEPFIKKVLLAETTGQLK